MELSSLIADARTFLEAEDIKYATDPVAYNTALSKLLGQLKKEKELGVAGVRQGYKGTGGQQHRRQMWVKMPGHERGGPDIWLDSGYVKIGGVIDVPRSVPSARKYDEDPPEAIYKWIVDTLKAQKAWHDAKYANPNQPPQESIMDKPMNTKLEELRAELEAHLDEGHSLKVGTIRMWKAGKYQKTSTGWVPVQSTVKSLAARAAHTSNPQDLHHVPVKAGSTPQYSKTAHGGRGKAEATPTAKLSKGGTPSYTHQIKGGGKMGASPLAFGSQSKPPPAHAGGVMLVKQGATGRATGIGAGSQSKPPPAAPGGVMGGKSHTAGGAGGGRVIKVWPQPGDMPPHAENIELGDEQFSFSPYAGFKRLAGLSDDRNLDEMLKKVADMDEDEVVSAAHSLAAQSTFARRGKRPMGLADSKRFKECMQRIKDEGMLGDDDQAKLLKKYKGEGGY